MDVEIDAEIHFYSENEAAVVLESRGNKNDDKFGEGLLFCRFAFQSMGNLQGDDIEGSLAQVLLGVNAKSLLKEEDLKLIEYNGDADKVFYIKLEYKGEEDSFFFNLKTSGFGFLGKGLGYYSPCSVMILLEYLLKKRSGDKKYISNLIHIANQSGYAYFKNLISMGNRFTLPLFITKDTFRQK